MRRCCSDNRDQLTRLGVGRKIGSKMSFERPLHHPISGSVGIELGLVDFCFPVLQHSCRRASATVCRCAFNQFVFFPLSLPGNASTPCASMATAKVTPSTPEHHIIIFRLPSA